MNELTLTQNSLIRSLSSLIESKYRKSLSGQEVIDALISISQEADARFEIQLLDDFWKTFEGHFSRYVRDIAANQHLNERPLYFPHEPISGYNSPHYCRKNSIKTLVPKLDVVNYSLLGKIAEEDEVFLMTFHIWYATSNSSYYFDSGALASSLIDMSFPKGLAQKIGTMYHHYSRFRGLRDQSEVETEIVQLLAPHQINPEHSPLRVLNNTPRDLFHYKDRFFTLPRSYPREEENVSLKNSGGWVDTIWGMGVYSCRAEPIGYVQFNKKSTPGSRFLLSP